MRTTGTVRVAVNAACPMAGVAEPRAANSVAAAVAAGTRIVTNIFPPIPGDSLHRLGGRGTDLVVPDETHPYGERFTQYALAGSAVQRQTLWETASAEGRKKNARSPGEEMQKLTLLTRLRSE